LEVYSIDEKTYQSLTAVSDIYRGAFNIVTCDTCSRSDSAAAALLWLLFHFLLHCRFPTGRLKVLYFLPDPVFDDDVRVCDMLRDKRIRPRVRRRQLIVYLDLRSDDGKR
jgi:hypothetical protein